MANQQSPVSPQLDLIALIESWDLHMDGPLDANTPLIASGLFDSLALFNLLVWNEQPQETIDDVQIKDVTIVDTDRHAPRLIGVFATKATDASAPAPAPTNVVLDDITIVDPVRRTALLVDSPSGPRTTSITTSGWRRGATTARLVPLTNPEG